MTTLQYFHFDYDWSPSKGDDELASETYDQNGNVLTSGGKSFSYDAENHLVAMNGGAVQMVYDAFGNRVAKTANGVTTRYLVNDLNPTGYPQMFDELTNGVVTRTYTYGLQRISETQAISNTWTTSYYGYDGMGTVRQLTNASGAISDTYDYDAFGNLVNSTGSTPNNYLYRSEQWDADLGLYYLRARYYDPVTGRFMARDQNDPEARQGSGTPIDPRVFHKYFYSSEDPVDRKDPTGDAEVAEYLGNLADKLNFFNTANFGNRGGQCQSYVYAGFGALLDPKYLDSSAEGSLVSYLARVETSCDVELVESVISPVPESPIWGPQ